MTFCTHTHQHEHETHSIRLTRCIYVSMIFVGPSPLLSLPHSCSLHTCVSACVYDGLVAFIFRETSVWYRAIAQQKLFYSFISPWFFSLLLLFCCCCCFSHSVPCVFLKANQITAIYEKLKAKNEQVYTLIVLECTRQAYEHIVYTHIHTREIRYFSLSPSNRNRTSYYMSEWVEQNGD